MSKVSLKSKTLRHRRRKVPEKKMIIKPYGFCCSIDDVDPLTKYDKLKSYKSSLMSLRAIHESPTFKFRTEFTDYMDHENGSLKKKAKYTDVGDYKRKNYKRNKQNLQNMKDLKRLYEKKRPFNKSNDFEDLHDEKFAYLLQGPMQWYLEDEINSAKDIFWEQKIRKYNEEMNKNTEIGKKKIMLMMKKETDMYPRWYQDFSINQIKNLRMLQCIMHKDCEEMVTGRTQRTLISIGIVSTFFTLTSDAIKKLQESSNCNVIEFLREVYKILTGNYFEEEGYKKFYDCNERIILSAIAFLTLPETVIELHKRLPPITMPKLYPKPTAPVISIRQKMKSPYEEELFMRPDWCTFYNHLQHWREQRKLTPFPNVILPPKECILNIKNVITNPYYKEIKHNKVQNNPENSQLIHVKNNPPVHMTKKENVFKTKSNSQKEKNIVKINKKQEDKKKSNIIHDINSVELHQDQTFKNEYYNENNEDEKLKKIINSPINTQKIQNDSQKFGGLNVPPLYENTLFDFTINGISEKPGPIEYKICGILQPPQANKKSWLDEKHAHYIIAGASDEPPTCPVTYEMTGVANVVPSNSDERFFAVLKLGDGPKKIYPSGRKNLSRHWQEWLQNVDEEFRKVEREANKMIKNIEAITKLVFPGPSCDSCCSCRQTRKSYFRAKETKAPYFVIDTIAEDDNKNKYIVGSMAMHSPAPTPPESTVNLLEVIASEDVLKTSLIINGITTETGETQYYITGAQEDLIRVPGRVIEPHPPRPPRNVPPCICAIQQMFNKGLTSTLSHDNIPWTKEDGLCFGKKFRPQEFPAYSCKKYPGDKSCRRSPFINEIIRLQKKAERKKQKTEAPGEKKMYSIADFQPCGDEHGMGICGGPWGTLHTLTPEELAEQEKLRKEILRSPPCGTKPGQAVCEGPFGTRIPKREIVIEEELVGEEEEVEEEEEKVEEAPPPIKIEKERKRDEKCYMSPQSIEIRKKEKVVEKVEKFIPDPTYHGYDDPWNIFRTAPTEKESETDFKTLLKLSSPKPPATPVQSKILVDETEKAALEKNFKLDTKKENLKEIKKIFLKDKKEKIPTKIPTISQIKEKRGREKFKTEKVSKSQSSKKEKISKSISQIGEKRGREKFKIEKVSKSQSSKKEKISIKNISQIAEKHNRGKFKSEEKSETKTFDKKSISSVKTKKMNDKVLQINMKNDETKGQNLSKSKNERDQKPNKNPSSSKYLEKQNEKSNPKKPISNKEISLTHDDQFNKTFQQKIHNVTNYNNNKQDKKKKNTKKSNHNPILLAIKNKQIKKKKSNPKSIRRDKKKDVYIDQDIDPETTYKNKIYELKNMLKSPELYPYDVKPVDIPDEPPAKCQLEYDYDIEPVIDTQDEADADIQLPSKGPCGWRTKSEQKLPTKKTLVYLSEPDYPPETVPVRSGGKPCICRENRAKKKILLYNIGGNIGGKKDDEEKKLLKKKKEVEDKKMQVIDGVIYYTPPPSPRRSDEYVPEYDLYDSPYDMCLSQRKDQNLKFFEQYSTPKISEVSKNKESCGCSRYIDTYGIQATEEDEEKIQLMRELDKTRETLINAKSPKERWNLALKDVSLSEYFTRCRDNLPCWLKCAKFNKVGCPISHRKLKTKRPVCECKYERKILEHREQKLKWKERQKRLKTLKKQPYINVADISKPLVPNTKLMISDVKRIPREDEYIDDIKYCITGVAENYSYLPPKQVVGGIHMATPIQTPEPSEHEIPCVCLHRHWSLTNIPPGPLPKPEEILLAEKKKRQEAVKEAFREIYAPQPVYHTHDEHSCKDTCGQNFNIENDENITENETKFKHNDNPNITSYLQKPIDAKSKLTNISQNTKHRVKSNIDYTQDKTEIKNMSIKKSSEIKTKSSYKKNKNTNITVQKDFGSKIKISDNKDIKTDKIEQKRLNISQKLENNPTESNIENVGISDKENEEDFDDSKNYLMAIVKIELKKMAAEGFLFAKLPKSFLMPQLRYWLMYRKGIVVTDKEKKKLLRKSINLWNKLDTITAKSEVRTPLLKMTKLQLRNLTFDDAQEIKRKIAMKKAMFYSQVRKERVLYGRSMWNSMEYGKFPSISFKQAYFTYMASKEADGHVFKPWMPSEIRDMN